MHGRRGGILGAAWLRAAGVTLIPVRVQQRRTKGWRKPPGAVSVVRGTRWGNPFKIGCDGTREEVVAKYRAGLLKAPELLARLPELRGNDLMCWCALDEPCHADVLLELANADL
jgi:Domain of unknown function (DUF4326)